MSAVGWCAITAPVASGTAKKTILQVLAAANHALWVKQFSFSFEGTSNTAKPILCEIARQSTAGTMTSLTVAKWPADDTDETLQVSAQHTSTGEPTTGSTVWSDYIHPQAGIDKTLPEKSWIKVGGGDRLAAIVTSEASVNCVAAMYGEE